MTRVTYNGPDLKWAGGRFVNGEVYEMPEEIAKELIKRSGFAIQKEENRNIGLEQQAYVEKITRKTKKEDK
jgi:hypothetical protein